MKNFTVIENIPTGLNIVAVHSKPIKLPKDKSCNNCKITHKVAFGVLCSARNFWFNCPCGSTLFVHKRDL